MLVPRTRIRTDHLLFGVTCQESTLLILRRFEINRSQVDFWISLS